MLTTGCSALSDSQYQLALQGFTGRYALRDRALFILGSRTGFRISELLSLRVRDVWNCSVLDSVHVARGFMKGKRKGRTMPLHAEAREALAAWLRSARLDDTFFANAYIFPRQGHYQVAMRRQNADLILRAAMQRAGLQKQGTHLMRKTFASRLWKSPLVNGDMFKMREILGHENLSNTAKYVQFLDGSLEAAVLS